MAVMDYVLTPGTETWETTGGATTWVYTMDPRTKNYVKTRVGGRDGGSRFLRISIDDRRYNQQLVALENEGHDPFTNGALKFLRVDGAPDDYVSDIDPTYHLAAEELAAYFEVKDAEIFRVSMEEISSELVLRRLLDVGEKRATMEQMGVLRDIVDARYKRTKTQKVIREMLAAENAMN